MTINQAAGQADPTNASPINFTVGVQRAGDRLRRRDVTISGTAGGTKTATVTGSGTHLQRGGQRHDRRRHGHRPIAAGAATDAAGNTNTASTSTDNTVTCDVPRRRR